jgi:hypothetical protein
MAEPLLPGLTLHQHGLLRAEWLAHQERGLPIPSIVEPLLHYEVEQLERDYARKLLAAPGAEVERRLGTRPRPNYESFSPTAGRANARTADFERGIRAIVRLIATGKTSGASDLQVLVDGGPADPLLTDVFDGAVKDLMSVQCELSAHWRGPFALFGFTTKKVFIVGSPPIVAGAR